MISTLAVSNYRSLRNLVLPLARLNIVTGPNGSGKSSLYRALRLLADISQGRIVASIAKEGGLRSTLWAGPETISRAMRSGEHAIEPSRKKQRVNLRLGFAGDEYGYLIDLGLPTPSSSAFGMDPQIKRECIWAGPALRPSALLVDRDGPVVKVRTDAGEWNVITDRISAFDSLITQVSDPRNAPETLFLREMIRGWRFYDQFRVDLDSPARSRQIGTWTPVLGHDGADLASAILTICELGQSQVLAECIDDAFPGSKVRVDVQDGQLGLRMEQKGLLRDLGAAELSDGTLRYLLWAAALLTPRPPTLMVLNEPETSLHPDLLGALARLIARCADRTQLIVVTHAREIVSALYECEGSHRIVLRKEFGETNAEGLNRLRSPGWKWPSR
jgi:predicted ATPase